MGKSAENAGEAIGQSKSSGLRALKELVGRGFVVCTTPASFGTNGRRAAEWRITALNVARFGKPKPTIKARASRDFMQWKPSSKKKPSATGGTKRATGGTNPPHLRVVNA